MPKKQRKVSMADLRAFVAQATLDQLDAVVTMIHKKVAGEYLPPQKPPRRAKAPPPKIDKPKRDASHLRVIQGSKK